MGTRGTQRSLCCHPLFSTGALWCPSTHIRYGRPGAKEPHAERPSPPSRPSLAGQRDLCTSAASLLRVTACSAHLSWPFSSSRPSVPSFPHLQPTSPAPLCRLRPSSQPAASPVGVPSRDMQKCHLPVADLLTQLRWRGQCYRVPCSVVSARLRCSKHTSTTPAASVGGSPPVWGQR